MREQSKFNEDLSTSTIMAGMSFLLRCHPPLQERPIDSLDLESRDRTPLSVNPLFDFGFVLSCHFNGGTYTYRDFRPEHSLSIYTYITCIKYQRYMLTSRNHSTEFIFIQFSFPPQQDEPTNSFHLQNVKQNIYFLNIQNQIVL